MAEMDIAIRREEEEVVQEDESPCTTGEDFLMASLRLLVEKAM